MMMKRLTCLLALAMTVPAFAGVLIIKEDPDKKAVATATAAVVAVATPVVPVVVTATTVRTWRVQSEDIRLSTTLERWSKEAGYNLIWDAQKQVLLSAKDSFDGTLEEALKRVLSSPAIRKSEYPLEACFYPNQPPVIRITRMGEQIEDCPQ